MNNAALRDIRIFLAFEANSGYEDDYGLQTEFFQASRLAMQMWESVFPAMRVKFVQDRSSANIVFSVGNHGNTVVPTCNSDGNPTGRGFHVTENPLGWIGCSLVPNNLGYINHDNNEAYNDATIYFNTQGQPNFRFDLYTYESRQQMWSSYQPATFPPINHNDGSGINGKLGWINGRFLRENANPLGWEDAVGILVHEFGHCFGQGHETVTPGLSSYGCPGANCSSPSLGGPYPPEITWQYYGCGTPGSPCTGNLKFGSYTAHHMVDYVTFPIYNGIPRPPLSKFNFRVLRQDALDYLLSQQFGYSGLHTYPNTRGLIRLRTSPTGSVALANNWTNAISLAQLSNANTTQSSPYLVTGIYNQGQMQKVAAGSNHVLAIRADGTLWAWGANDKGQLGDGTTTLRTIPVPILSSVKTWVSVAAGNGFSMALRSDNSLWAWGGRTNGQLGDGVASGSSVTSPKKIGNNEWAAVKAGALHTVALKTNGTLWTWGYNGYGQLGIGGTSERSTPTQEIKRYNDWVGLAAGEVNSAGQRADGSLWTWGWNDNGNVGDGTYTIATEPRREAWYLDKWQLPSLGYNFSMNLDREGKVWTWGANAHGQLGASPTDIAHMPMNRVGEGWVTASAGQLFAGGIKKDGTLWSWGSNASGQLGGGSGVGSISATPVQEVTRKTDWQEVYSGLNTAFAMKQDGTLWAWGDNASGQRAMGYTGPPSHTPTITKWTYFPATVSIGPGGHIRAGTSITLTAYVTGNAASVSFYRRNDQGVDQLISGTVTRVGQTYTLSWTNPPLGANWVVAKAFESFPSAPAVSEAAYVFSESVIIEAGTVTSANLSTEGTVFWEHFGHASSQYGYTVVKSGTVPHFNTPEITNGATPTPATPQSGEPAMVSHSWTQGIPSAYATGTNISKALGIPTSGLVVGNGFALFGMSHGDRGSEWVAKLYVYARNVSTTLEVGTSSGTWTQDWNGANGSRVYTIRYRIDGTPNIVWKIKSLGSGSPKTMRFQAITLR